MWKLIVEKKLYIKKWVEIEKLSLWKCNKNEKKTSIEKDEQIWKLKNWN